MKLRAGLQTLWCLAPIMVSSAALKERDNPTAVSYTTSQAFTQYPGQFAGPLGPNNIVFQMQYDGNFVAYSGSTPVWNSGTGGNTICQQANQCWLNWQPDGNLVVYIQGRAIWDSATGGGDGYRLMLNDAPPYVVILKSNNEITYSSGGRSNPPPFDPCIYNDCYD